MSYRKTIFILCLSVFLSAERNANAQADTTFVATGSGQTGTIQHFTVPPCATTITVVANGAQGGDNGGLGAKIQGVFNYPRGTVLDILVGQAGCSNDNLHGSGGGGSFVVLASNDTILVIAGGGGGHGASGIDNTSEGSALRAGQSGAGSGSPATGGGGGAAASGATGGVGCNNGSPAGGSTWAGGGGGFCGNGGMYNSGASYGGYSYKNGGNGGTAATGANCVGGFGGGSGAGDRGGGGGGYSGGAGGTSNNIGGGGGGSYNAGTNQVNTAGGAAAGNGSVTIYYNATVIPVTVSGHVILNEVTCDGHAGEANAITTGIALSYLWTPSGQTTDTATGLAAGTYTIAVSSPCGGSQSTTVTITQPVNAISAIASVVTNESCHGGSNGSATVAISGVGSPYTYMWTPSGETTSLANGLTAGNYTVSVVNACGATASASTTITEPIALGITANVTANVLCNGGNNGSAISQAHSGTPPYNYMWVPSGGNLDTTFGLEAGIYSVILTDANGCTGSAGITITQPSVLTTLASTVTDVACNGGSTGSAMSTPNGGTNPYTYAWTGGQTNATANGLSIGTYTVNIMDNHGCTASAHTIITQPTVLNVISNTTPDSTSCTGTAWVTASGGVFPYTYAWTPGGNTTYYVHYACHDTFCYVVTDNHGCKDTGCAVITSELGVNNITANKGTISVYPNPSNGQFTVESSVNGGQFTVEVYNMLGEKVYSQMNISQTTYQINLGGQTAGIYLYRVMSTENGNLLGEGKLVIQK